MLKAWAISFLTGTTPQTSGLHSYCHLLKNDRNLPEGQQGLAGHHYLGHPVNNNKKEPMNTVLGCPRLSMNKVCVRSRETFLGYLYEQTDRQTEGRRRLALVGYEAGQLPSIPVTSKTSVRSLVFPTLS